MPAEEAKRGAKRSGMFMFMSGRVHFGECGLHVNENGARRIRGGMSSRGEVLRDPRLEVKGKPACMLLSSGRYC